MTLLDLKTQFGMGRMQDTMGQSVTFAATGSGGSAITAVCTRGTAQREVVDQGGMRVLVDVQILTVRAAAADVTGYARDVSTVTLDGEVWTVRASGGNAGLVVLVCDQQAMAAGGVTALRFG